MQAIRSIIIFLTFLGSLSAAPSTAKRAQLYQLWNEQSIVGGVDVVDTQIDRLKKALAKDPSDELARAFLGSSFALRAKHGWWGPTKLSDLKKGKKLLELAVQRAPQDPRVRLVRAAAYSRVPKKFGVRNTSISDFETLVRIADQGQKSDLTANERQAIYYFAAQLWTEENRSAANLYQRCISVSPNSAYGRKAKQALSR